MPAMKDATPRTIYLKEYAPPPYLIDNTELRFELGEQDTRVRADLRMRRNPAFVTTADGDAQALVLDGQGLDLQGLWLDEQVLTAADYEIQAESLTIHAVPDTFELRIEVRIRPQDNTALEGLYRSSGNFCTQCEAEGFRRIVYYLDRPDVMSRFATTIIADPERYPVMLSNGNRVDAGTLNDGRAWVRWEDPFHKPAYLFALVAGDLVQIADTFTTVSGREVDLHIFVEQRNADKCAHAMASLKKAMAWDEQSYGREYDLDVYMIVAVDDFNMGAMENKGLNVFNSKYVLARPDTATDDDYEGIEAVIAHEYFHNWSGNRVTCRDWFQLSLKEGFTVFRDQSFTADMTSAAVKRIKDVQALRSYQFREDSGPLAHPVRPDSYQEINNFYTLTVYEKGAEVVRMIHNLLGAKAFRQGTDLYFKRHDGQAVTTDDFVQAMEDASGVDLGQFRCWYSQAGTPHLQVSGHYDAAARAYTLAVTQSTPPTPRQPDKLPLHIPLRVGLVDAEGNDLPLRLRTEGAAEGTDRVLQLREAGERFVFEDIDAEPTPSLLRGFSAPVKLDYAYSDAQLAFLMANDSDPFNRWDAGLRLAAGILLRRIEGGDGATAELDTNFITAYRKVLEDSDGDHRLVAQSLTLPSHIYLSQQVAVIDPVAIHDAREFMRLGIASALREPLLATWRRARPRGPYKNDGASVGGRALANTCLSLLCALDDAELHALARRQFDDADNMTDALAALSAIVFNDTPDRDAVLAAFYQQWQHDPLVIDKWLSIQAMTPRSDALRQVQALMQHEAFSIKNPNKVRALIGAFCAGNPLAFHAADGSGYCFLADQVLALDQLNPQVASRMVTPFSQWRRYDQQRQGLMHQQLERIVATQGLSPDVSELASKSL